VIDERAVVVARRAAEQASASQVDLPDELALWRLAGGRPRVGPVAGEPEELGGLLERAFEPSVRRRQGAHFTPAPLAAQLVERALAGRSHATVGDPACGGGSLLLAAARHLAARGQRPQEVVRRLWGADIDPVAVATTEAALTLWAGSPTPVGRVVVADALEDDLDWPPLDVVVGNPPFLSQLDARTARSVDVNQRLRKRFGPAVRAYTDTATVFLLCACELAAAGGTVALLQPQSVLAARGAAGVRDAVDTLGTLTDVWFPEGRGFDAAVEVCAPIIDIAASGAGTPWSTHLARANGVPPVTLAATRSLSDEAITTAAFRSEYYGMVDGVHEAVELPHGVPMVTTGLIDLGRCAWGERPARVGRRTWQRPVLDVDALEGRAADWVRRTRVPKLMVATQTRVVEVVVDELGEWIPGVPLVVVLAPPERLWPLAAALAAPAVSAWLLQQVAGTALTAQSLKVTAALLREVPLPTDATAWALGTDAFRDDDLDAFARAMATAYGTSLEVSDWWRERAKRVWSRPAPHR